MTNCNKVSVVLHVPLAVMFCVAILCSCGVLLRSKHPFQQCVVPVKCMSLVMYCVISIKCSVFNDLE